MIDLKALKEQLRLLGHDLPDEQVVAILKEMSIDFHYTPAHREPLDTSNSPEGNFPIVYSLPFLPSNPCTLSYCRCKQ